MRIFVAGATGAIGKRLVPLLVQAGHSVTGTTRSAAKAGSLRSAGAEPAIVDALNAAAVAAAVEQARPEVIIHELTAIPPDLDLRKFEEQFRLTNRLRTEGTDYLLAAARSAGVRRFIAQSYAGWPYVRSGGPVKTEDDPLDPNPPAGFRETIRALRHVESAVLEAPGMEGIVLRYGGFYGPGNAIGEGGILVEQTRHRRVPIIGGGTGIWSFIHIDDAARATLATVDRGRPGVYNIVDDDPAPVSEWLPELARILGAKPPFRVPAWVGRLAIGDLGVVMMTQARGASNAKAKRDLSWQPIWASWRDGFRDGLSESPATGRTQSRNASVVPYFEYRPIRIRTQRMRALALTRRPTPGTLPDVIQMVEIADPAPRSREVIVRVLASSINIDDIHVAEGTFYGGIPIGARPRPDRPVTPGSDLAGIVIGVGDGVRSIHVGEAVFGVQVPFRARGAWAEVCAVDERWLTTKPEKLSFGTAAACGVSGLVAFSAIDALKLRAGCES